MKTKNIFLVFIISCCFFLTTYATETEPNNTRATANTLTLNGSNSGSINAAGDEDWWSVTTTGDGLVSVTISVSNTQYIDCYFYDNDGTTQLGFGRTNAAPLTISTDGLATGTYYIRVVAYYSNGTPAYSLSNSFTAPTQANDAEPNGTRGLAKVLPLGGSKTGHIDYYYNHLRDTSDWWKITTTGDGKLDISLTSYNGQYVDCYLFDNDGSTQLKFGETNAGPVTITKDGLEAGTYYIKIVTFYNTGFAPYSVGCTFTAPAQANDAEPDSTRALALALPLNGSTTGHINYYYNFHRDTLDWYKVTSDADGRIRLRMTSHSGQYLRCYLFDNNGSTQLNYLETNSNADMNTDGLAAGTYYVLIRTYYTDGFAPYTISDSLFGPEQANDTEPNGTMNQALSFGLNTTATGHISYYYNLQKDSADWYKITTTIDGMINLTITSGNGQYLRCYLLDNNGTTQLNYMEPNGTQTIKTDGLAAGTYYVKIQTYYASGFAPYTLANSFTAYTYTNDATAEPNDAAYQAKTIPANDSVKGHINFRNNGGSRNTTDWWKVNYTGSGNLTIKLYEEAWKVNGGYHYWKFSVYKDTNSSPIYYSEPIGALFTVNLTTLAQGYYWIKLGTYYGSEFMAYSLKSEFTQSGIATISILNTTAPANCDATGVLRIQCGSSKPPYTVILYRFGFVYGNPVVVTNTSPFNINNLPTGYWRARIYGDGATGSAYGQSQATSLMPVPAGLSTANITSTQAKLSFGTFTPCIDGYAVQFHRKGETNWSLDTAVKSPFTLKGLSAGTAYTWRVASGDTSNTYTALSKYSDSATFTTLTAAFAISDANESSIASGQLNNALITAIPNPAQSQVKLQVANKINQIVNAALKDGNGRIVWIRLNVHSGTLNNQIINVTGLQNGIYLLQITGTGNQPIATQKIIVAH